MDWENDPDPTLTEFVANLVALRRACRSLRRRHFLIGSQVGETALKDVHWLSPDGTEMDEAAWADGERQAFGMQMSNDIEGSERVLILINAAREPCPFALPPALGGPWRPVFDTTLAVGAVPEDTRPAISAGGTVALPERAVLVLKAPPALT